MHAKYGSRFKFTIGNVIYEFTNELWNSLFGITIIDPDVRDELDLLVHMFLLTLIIMRVIR